MIFRIVDAIVLCYGSKQKRASSRLVQFRDTLRYQSIVCIEIGLLFPQRPCLMTPECWTLPSLSFPWNFWISLVNCIATPESPGPPGPKWQKRLKKSLLWVCKKVSENTRKSQQIRQKIQLWVFFDFFGYFRGFSCRPPKRLFLRHFLPFWARRAWRLL